MASKRKPRQLPLTAVPIWHASDPKTSAESGVRVTERGSRQAHCDTVFAAVERHPGKTAGELGELTELGRVEAARRLSDLKAQGRVFMYDRRVCTVQGTAQYAWYAVGRVAEAGR